MNSPTPRNPDARTLRIICKYRMRCVCMHVRSMSYPRTVAPTLTSLVRLTNTKSLHTYSVCTTVYGAEQQNSAMQHKRTLRCGAVTGLWAQYCTVTSAWLQASATALAPDISIMSSRLPLAPPRWRKTKSTVRLSHCRDQIAAQVAVIARLHRLRAGSLCHRDWEASVPERV